MTILERLKFRLENHMAVDRALGFEVLKELQRLSRFKRKPKPKARKRIAVTSG